MADSDHLTTGCRSGLRLCVVSSGGPASISLAQQTAAALQIEYLGTHESRTASDIIRGRGARGAKPTAATRWDAVVVCGDDGLSVQPLQFSSGPIRPTFVSGKTQHRQLYGGGRNQPLARALGIGKLAGSASTHDSESSPALSVVDATAGFGRDAWVIATLGCQVTLLEREPWLGMLLRQALTEASGMDETSAIAARMQLVTTGAADWFESQPDASTDAVYLDPMYPQQGKKAQAKKEMQLLQSMTTIATRPELLLGAALHIARYRVVVKRPASAPLINHPDKAANSTHSANTVSQHCSERAQHFAAAGAVAKPAGTVSSPNTRYDIYTPSASLS